MGSAATSLKDVATSASDDAPSATRAGPLPSGVAGSAPPARPLEAAMDWPRSGLSASGPRSPASGQGEAAPGSMDQRCKASRKQLGTGEAQEDSLASNISDAASPVASASPTSFSSPPTGRRGQSSPAICTERPPRPSATGVPRAAPGAEEDPTIDEAARDLSVGWAREAAASASASAVGASSPHKTSTTCCMPTSAVLSS
mmetsp:Transcript_100342/g.289734  ORF Transcript_100342/g.289734 Transcript_100342/m.289734 type:complete len:201 (+) Transcript_100342:904-1506(+)